LLKQQLELLLVLPTAKDGKFFAKQNSTQYVRKVVTVNRRVVKSIANKLRVQVRNPRKIRTTSYIPFAKQLYELLIAPLEPELTENQIDTLIFSMNKGLRAFPIAALNNGEQFLIEKYAVGLIPSFSLTDTRYRPLENPRLLAFGVMAGAPVRDMAAPRCANGKYPETDSLTCCGCGIAHIKGYLGRNLSIKQRLWLTLNCKTVPIAQRGAAISYSIIHVATHAEFKPGKIENSYIQFWNEKLQLDRLRQLSEKSQWSADPKVELLVLSACKTALGNEQAELGFAGLALQAGVKTAIGSLWYVSDRGSLALMSEFYHQLKTAPLKTEALRQTQLAMLKEQVLIKDGQLQLPDRVIPIPEEIASTGLTTLSHPYFWSAFTVIGNWN